ncbi:zf-HC2 domain-containing protein [Actinokineospora spheciospongiae]|uniref:zf-HC2 domain-containing protein n=1 Tax=Actinokineospora spheciospongiae TaxID=909613 RepID=UPI000551EB82|nr:zf-HC2 domain-containing protein [Actinokineospora spheciospongiae]
MDCVTCREALSARLDGEAEPVAAERTDEHLDGCTACLHWWARAGAGARLLRVRPAARVPDLTDLILENAPTPARTPGLVPRFLLGLVAVAQLGLGLAQIFGTDAAAHGGHPDSSLALHLFNESTAWNLALGIGFYWVAWRPRNAIGMVPVLSGFVLVLLGYSAHDLITGSAPVPRVLGHGLIVAGLILLIAIRRVERDPVPGDLATDDREDTVRLLDDPGEPDRAEPGTPRTGRHLRPAGKHRAA